MSISRGTQAVEDLAVGAANDTIMAQLMQGLDAVETAMFEVCNSDVVVLRDASRHILAAGGKRIRPRLALLSYAAAGGHDMREVARIAAAVELMHTASIVHDDINDHGVLRRGRPSVNAIWGRTFALLTGDFLFTKVYELMSPYKDLNIILADAAIALVEGETLQAAAVKENRFTREVYYDIIGRKTAALFRAAGLLGAHRAGATREQIDALGNFAFSIGLAFQIIDDILDITADSEKLGKTANIDLAQGKGYAAVNGGSSNGGGVAVAEQPADPMEKIKEKMLNGNYVEEGQQKAGELVQIAIAQLTVLPDSPAKSELIALANTTIEREY